MAHEQHNINNTKSQIMALSKLNKYYIIQIKVDGWQNFDETKYTEQEANIALRNLKRNCCYPVRKRFIEERVDQVLTVKR